VEEYALWVVGYVNVLVDGGAVFVFVHVHEHEPSVVWEAMFGDYGVVHFDCSECFYWIDVYLLNLHFASISCLSKCGAVVAFDDLCLCRTC